MSSLDKSRNKQDGFTIVELLIVIVVIAILASISVVAYNGIQARSQDAKRAQDFATIEKALRGYEAIYGGVPMTNVYGGGGGGGWNNSTMTNWLTFLESEFGKMPRDSKNFIQGTAGMPDESGERVYFYYCYPASTTGGWPSQSTVRFGFRSEKTDTIVDKYMTVTSCLTALP